MALRLPLQENRIVAWKFCHVLHIILREGHYNCLEQSQRHTGMIQDLGKLWVTNYSASIPHPTDFLLCTLGMNHLQVKRDVRIIPLFFKLILGWFVNSSIMEFIHCFFLMVIFFNVFPISLKLPTSEVYVRVRRDFPMHCFTFL